MNMSGIVEAGGRSFSLRPQKDLDNYGEIHNRADRGVGSSGRYLNNGVGFTKFDRSDIPKDKSWKYHRLMKRQRRSKTEEEQRKVRIFVLIDKLCEALGLTKGFQEQICLRYLEAKRKGLTKSRDSRAMVGGIAYLVCKEWNVPRTRWEVLEGLEGMPTLGNMFGKDIESEELDMSTFWCSVKALREGMDFDTCVPKPAHFLGRFASRLSLDEKERAKAWRILQKIDGELNTKPTLLVGSVLYLVSDLSQREVSEKLNLGISGVCQYSKEIRNIVDEGESA